MSSNCNIRLSSVKLWPTHTHVSIQSLCSWAYKAFVGPHMHTSIHSYTHIHAETHPNTSVTPHTNTLAVCPKVQNLVHCCLQAPLFQGKSWPFTSILVFACTNCQTVQTIPGHWCLKAHSVSRHVQVILPKLLTGLVSKANVAREVKQEF